MYVLSMMLKYLCAWLLMLATLAGALFAEGLYSLLYGGSRQLSQLTAPLRTIVVQARKPVILPDTARFVPSLYGPALAFAALLPICASIPFCTVIPLLDNGGDLMQIFEFALLSEVLGVAAVYSLGTISGDAAAKRFVEETLCTMTIMVACFASLAYYFESAGLSGDPFSLNTFTTGMRTLSVPWCVYAGIAVFVFLILSRTGIHDSELGCAIFEDGELVAYQGAPRAILYLWAIFKVFILTALVTHTFFPWGLFQSASASQEGGISWRMQTLNFVFFWLAVVLVRVALVPLCSRLFDKMCGLLPKKLAWLPLPLFTVAAVLLVVYGASLIVIE